MPIVVTCPNCQRSLSARDDLAGRAVRCPQCSAELRLPAAIPPAPGAAPASAPRDPAATPSRWRSLAAARLSLVAALGISTLVGFAAGAASVLYSGARLDDRATSTAPREVEQISAVEIVTDTLLARQVLIYDEQSRVRAKLGMLRPYLVIAGRESEHDQQPAAAQLAIYDEAGTRRITLGGWPNAAGTEDPQLLLQDAGGQASIHVLDGAVVGPSVRVYDRAGDWIDLYDP